jgi:hypothetical protein
MSFTTDLLTNVSLGIIYLHIIMILADVYTLGSGNFLHILFIVAHPANFFFILAIPPMNLARIFLHRITILVTHRTGYYHKFPTSSY